MDIRRRSWWYNRAVYNSTPGYVTREKCILAREGKTEEEIIPDFLIFYKTYFDEPGITEEIFDKYESADPHWMNVGGLLRYWNKYQLADK